MIPLAKHFSGKKYSVSDPLFFFTDPDPDPTQKSKADPDPDPSKETSNCVNKQKEKKCAYFALRT